MVGAMDHPFIYSICSFFYVMFLSHCSCYLTEPSSLHTAKNIGSISIRWNFFGSSGQYRLSVEAVDGQNQFPNSTIVLDVTQIPHRSLDVYTVQGDGPPQKVNTNTNPEHFEGHIYNDGWKQRKSVTGFGTLSQNRITLVLYIEHYIFVPNDTALGTNDFTNVHSIFEISPQFTGTYRHKRYAYHHSRMKRDNGRKFCGLKMVISNDLYRVLGKDIGLAVQLAQSTIDYTNQIFMKTAWTASGYLTENDDVLEGYGIVLCKLIIHTDNGGFELNDTNWAAYLHRYIDSGYCLIHLLTNQNLSVQTRIINGASKVGNIFEKDNGGISTFHQCATPYYLYCMLNVVHEFGHAFGSRHDVDTPECMPQTGGSYLMNEPFIPNVGENNFKFSPCSRRDIYRQINGKRKLFISLVNGSCQLKSFCGDLLVEGEEQCDEGSSGGLCCDKYCQLKPGMKCSTSKNGNHCCQNCQIAADGKICKPFEAKYCLAEVFCDGIHETCPDVNRTLPDNTPCDHDGGTCLQGFCHSCLQNRCDCPHSYQCSQCCYDAEYNCIPKIPVPDGQTCSFNHTHLGQCTKGKCEMLDIIHLPTPAPTPTARPAHRPSGSNPTFQILIGFLICIIILLAIGIIFCLNKSSERDAYQPPVDCHDNEKRPPETAPLNS